MPAAGERWGGSGSAACACTASTDDDRRSQCSGGQEREFAGLRDNGRDRIRYGHDKNKNFYITSVHTPPVSHLARVRARQARIRFGDAPAAQPAPLAAAGPQAEEGGSAMDVADGGEAERQDGALDEGDGAMQLGTAGLGWGVLTDGAVGLGEGAAEEGAAAEAGPWTWCHAAVGGGRHRWATR